jgi:poly(A) polymerase
MLGAVADILKRRATEGWLVGGSVRDRLLGRYSPDLDVVVADDAAAVAAEVAVRMHAPCFALSERYPTYRVLSSDGHVDVTAVRGGSILADLAERDFTVNAMAVPVAAIVAAGLADGLPATLAGGDSLLDPFGGATHLRQERLVAVSQHIFTEDPLRLMRAPRFCHTLGLRLDDALELTVKEQAPKLSGVAAERVVNEICLTLASGHAAAAVRLWHGLGLLAVMLPELEAPGVAAGVWMAETLALLDSLDGMLAAPGHLFADTAGFLQERLAVPVDGAVARPVALRLAGLLHSLDVERVRVAGQRLKLSGALVSLLVAVSRRVGRQPGGPGGGAGQAAGLTALLPAGAPVSRAAVLLLWDAAPWEPEVIMLAAAREAAVAGMAPERGDVEGVARRLMVLAAERARGGPARCPVDGDVLMRELGLASGPALGRALREARLAWEAGEAKTAAEVLAVARAVVS